MLDLVQFFCTGLGPLAMAENEAWLSLRGSGSAGCAVVHGVAGPAGSLVDGGEKNLQPLALFAQQQADFGCMDAQAVAPWRRGAAAF